MEQDRVFGCGKSLQNRCPFCHGGLSGETYTCGNCGTTHHKGCWDENNGCTAMGCAWNSRIPQINRDKQDAWKELLPEHRSAAMPAADAHPKPPFVPHDFTMRMSPATAAMWSTLASFVFMIVGKFNDMGGELVLWGMGIIIVFGTIAMTWYSETKRRPGEATLWEDMATWWQSKRR